MSTRELKPGDCVVLRSSYEAWKRYKNEKNVLIVMTLGNVSTTTNHANVYFFSGAELWCQEIHLAALIHIDDCKPE